MRTHEVAQRKSWLWKTLAITILVAHMLNHKAFAQLDQSGDDPNTMHPHKTNVPLLLTQEFYVEVHNLVRKTCPQLWYGCFMFVVYITDLFSFHIHRHVPGFHGV